MFIELDILMQFDDDENYLLSWSDIQKKVPLSDPIISKHLTRMHKNGLLFKHKNGVYAITPKGKTAFDELRADGYSLVENFGLIARRKLGKRSFRRVMKAESKQSETRSALVNHWKDLLKENGLDV